MCVYTLEVWHAMHCLAQVPTCFCRLFHTYFVAACFLVVRTEGWAKPWITSKILRLHVTGTIGQAWPVEVSQRMVTHRGPMGISSSFRPEVVLR